MKYRQVGSSGLAVSEIALGSWLTYGAAVSDATALECLETAVDEGIVFFDTADVYAAGAAEAFLGRFLADRSRSDFVVATKAYFPMSENPNDRGLSRKHLLESIHASLRRLRTDYVDLYQCHRFDPETPIAETVRAMDDLVRQGKILYWGVSCWDENQIAEALRIADATNAVRPISNQPPYSMLERGIEPKVLPLCESEGVAQLAFSPLAEGLLTGKYSPGSTPPGSRAEGETIGRFLRPKMTERNFAIVDRLGGLAKQAGLTLAQLALAWDLRHPSVASVIIGASRPEQIRENVRAAGITLEKDLLREIEMVLSAT